MTTDNALAGGDAATALVDESVSSPATDAAQNTASASETQTQEGSQTDAQSEGKSSEVKTSGESDAAKNTDKGKEEPKRTRVQERIDDLTRARRDAERRAAAAEAEVARLTKPLPVRQDMTQDELDRLTSRNAYRDEMRDQAAETAKAAAQQAGETRRQIFEAKVDAIKDRAPDALAKFYSVPCSPMMADYLAEADKAGELALFLGSNPHEARRITELPPTRQAIELAKIEGRLSSAPEVRRVSQAPAPAENRLKGGSSPTPLTPEKASIGDIQAMLRKSGVIHGS